MSRKRNTVLLLLFLGLVGLVLILGVPRIQAAKMRTVTFKIEGQGIMKGMVCDVCRHTVQSALTKVDGVSKVDVNLKEGKCTVKFDKGKVKVADLQQAVENTKVFKARVLEEQKWWRLR